MSEEMLTSVIADAALRAPLDRFFRLSFDPDAASDAGRALFGAGIANGWLPAQHDLRAIATWHADVIAEDGDRRVLLVTTEGSIAPLAPSLADLLAGVAAGHVDGARTVAAVRAVRAFVDDDDADYPEGWHRFDDALRARILEADDEPSAVALALEATRTDAPDVTARLAARGVHPASSVAIASWA